MRTGYGSGSVKQIAPGKYLIRVSGGSDPLTGQRRRINEVFVGTPKEAERRRATLVAEHADGPVVGATLGEVVAAYFSASIHAETTARTYASAIKLLPAKMANQKADALTTKDFDVMFAHLLKQGRPLSTLNHLRTIISAAYNTHIMWNRLKVNPTTKCSLPRMKRKQIVLPGDAAVQRMFDIAADYKHPDMPVWLRLLAVTGARRGESLAWRWSDYEPFEEQLFIGRVILPNGVERELTKTATSRWITLDGETMEMLDDWRVHQQKVAAEVGVEMVANPFLFSRDPEGSVPMSADTMYARFRILAKKADIKGLTPHKFRHLMVSKAIDSGLPTNVVSKRAGHSRESVTTDVYNHVINRRDRIAGREIGSMMPMPKKRSA